MKKILFTFIIISASILLVNGQHERQFTQFMHNKLTFNPAVAGTEIGPAATLLYRKQWINIDAAPETKLFNFHTPAFHGRAGFGVAVANYQIGILDSWNAKMAYSYGVRFSKTVTLHIGVQAGLSTYDVMLSSPNINVIDMGDPLVLNDIGEVQESLNFGAGLYLNTEHFYGGISVPNFYNRPFDAASNVLAEEPHFYAMAGGKIPLSSNISLTPALLGKYNINAPIDFDFHLGMGYADRFNAGVSYRLGGNARGESVDFLLFYHLTKSLGLGAAYDFSLSEFKDQSNGSIELLLKYVFSRKRNDMANPRFFRQAE